MFSHKDIWQAIDALARIHGLSTSALAKRAGLDATSFNKSKRVTASGRPRWPSSESLSKVLACTSTSLDEFTALITAGKQAARQDPLRRTSGHAVSTAYTGPAGPASKPAAR